MGFLERVLLLHFFFYRGLLIKRIVLCVTVSQQLNATGKMGAVLPGCGVWTMWFVLSKEAGTNSNLSYSFNLFLFIRVNYTFNSKLSP